MTRILIRAKRDANNWGSRRLRGHRKHVISCVGDNFDTTLTLLNTLSPNRNIWKVRHEIEFQFLETQLEIFSTIFSRKQKFQICSQVNTKIFSTPTKPSIPGIPNKFRRQNLDIYVKRKRQARHTYISTNKEQARRWRKISSRTLTKSCRVSSVLPKKQPPK